MAEAARPPQGAKVEPQDVTKSAELKEGDVLTYSEYKARRTKGSTLRGHHVPQSERLKEKGIDPDEGTVVVLEHSKSDVAGNKIGHTGTRTYGRAGSTTAAAEEGMSLAHSETLDLADPAVERLGPEVQERIRQLNRTNHPDHY